MLDDHRNASRAGPVSTARAAFGYSLLDQRDAERERLARSGGRLCDHVAAGDRVADHGALDRGLRIRSMILPDVFIDHDTPAAMYAFAGLDSKGIVKKVFEALGKDIKTETVKLA